MFQPVSTIYACSEGFGGLFEFIILISSFWPHATGEILQFPPITAAHWKKMRCCGDWFSRVSSFCEIGKQLIFFRLFLIYFLFSFSFLTSFNPKSHSFFLLFLLKLCFLNVFSIFFYFGPFWIVKLTLVLHKVLGVFLTTYLGDTDLINPSIFPKVSSQPQVTPNSIFLETCFHSASPLFLKIWVFRVLLIHF